MKPETWLETLNCAVEGILHAVRSQRHMRWHAVTSLVVLVLAPRFGVTPPEFALLCLAVALVLVTELANTALESVVDLASPDFNPLARAAKDVAAGAVLVAAFGAVAVGWAVLLPRVAAAVPPAALEGHVLVVTASVLLSVVVLVVLVKAVVGRGQPLRGGFPSGHSAVSFALATVLALHTRDPVVAVLAVLLALMVSHSRLLLRIHTRFEVVSGALLGAGVAALLYGVMR